MVRVLSNNSELLTLAIGDVTIQRFAYDDSWFPQTDLGGLSVETIDAANPDLTSWSSRESWQASQISVGSPGMPTQAGITGDLNGDQQINVADTDRLTAGVREESQSSALDVNRDAVIDEQDVISLVENIHSTCFGDIDLNGDVDQTDFEQLATNFGEATDSWSDGDFDGDGDVDFSDFTSLSISFGFIR